MNTYELDTQTLANIDEAATDANRTALSAGFLASYNCAYARICVSLVKPTKWQQVTLDANRQFDTAVLDSKILLDGIVAVKAEKDFAAAGGFGRATNYSFYWAEGNQVAAPMCGLPQAWVCYRHYPEPLTNPSPLQPLGNASSPNLLDSACHGVLAMAAAADYFRAHRKFDREQAWLEAYHGALVGMAGRKDGSTGGIRGKYPAMPQM